jgi:uncharacterized protein (DUF1684 family)
MDSVAQLESFRGKRHQAVTSPQGSLALANTQWIDQEQSVWSVPGLWSPAAEGLALTAAVSDGIVVNGETVDGRVTVYPKTSETPSTLEFSDGRTGTIIGQDGNFALRVWDPNSEEMQRFSHIDSFDYRPEWVCQATWREIPGGSLVGFEHLKDEGSAKDEVVPGDIIFDFDGQTYTLSAFKAGKALQLVFADQTNGETTYSVGRFLFCQPNPDGTITLNFNYAILPPCAFSYHFNCPLPPAQNRFPFAIEAGEKNVMAAGGELLHAH